MDESTPPSPLRPRRSAQGEALTTRQEFFARFAIGSKWRFSPSSAGRRSIEQWMPRKEDEGLILTIQSHGAHGYAHGKTKDERRLAVADNHYDIHFWQVADLEVEQGEALELGK